MLVFHVLRTYIAQHFNSFDFTTLYTNIPHDSLKDNLIKEPFKVRGSRYLSITYKGSAYWSQNRSSIMSIDETSLVDMLEFLVDNTYVVGVIRYIGSALVFRWVLIMHHSWPTYSCFVI